MTVVHEDRTSIDGRHRRAQASREAIVEALVGLYAEGSADPSAAQIAQRAGVSERSLFRHFDDINDLCHTAFEVQWARLADRSTVSMPMATSTRERVETLVTRRVQLYLDMLNVMRITRMHAVRNTTVASHIRSSRKELRRQHERLFNQELDAMSTEAAHAAKVAIEALLSFEHIEQLRLDQGLSPSRIEVILTSALLHVLRP
ncbi:MAG: TetR/AcrR family transcriptional regulator [Ilumatobacteraceae bacterium]|jgi:TetR/AcrR family transcriptional regulator of autoinduction and epiphytic fitness|nr:TetR/AcrR family transcriptional regulator [Ilumatobacteraceae bacterium]